MHIVLKRMKNKSNFFFNNVSVWIFIGLWTFSEENDLEIVLKIDLKRSRIVLKKITIWSHILTITLFADVMFIFKFIKVGLPPPSFIEHQKQFARKQFLLIRPPGLVPGVGWIRCNKIQQSYAKSIFRWQKEHFQ